MEKVPVFVGPDYHSRGVQVCVMDEAGRVLSNRSCGNSVPEVASAVRAGWTVRRAAIEICCGAADLAEALIRDLGWLVNLAHPAPPAVDMIGREDAGNGRIDVDGYLGSLSYADCSLTASAPPRPHYMKS